LVEILFQFWTENIYIIIVVITFASVYKK